LSEQRITASPIRDFVAAVSVGVVQGVPVLDLDYTEDSGCDTDMNVVMTGRGGFVEVQGTAEGAPFSRQEMDALLELARQGIGELVQLQRQALEVG
jgi:ribonuclease PH